MSVEILAAGLLGWAGSAPLPNAEAVGHAIAAWDRSCLDSNDATPCEVPGAVPVRDMRCKRWRVPRVDHYPYEDAEAAAHCNFSYRSVQRVGENRIHRRWLKGTAHLYWVGIPCGGEGQEADMICYSWLNDDRKFKPVLVGATP